MSKYDYYKKLKDDIKKWNDSYYKDSVSLVSDYEFDKALEELKKIEDENPDWVTDDSPTINVGSSLDEKSRFPKVEHSSPMISLENSYNYDDIRRFLNRIKEAGATDIVIESKLDGLSLALIYRKGELVKAVTRGDGRVGEDVYKNALEIHGIPRYLSKDVDIEVRGEVLMSFESFETENRFREENRLPLYANPRNLASGTLRNLDPNIVKQRKLEFFAYFLMPSPFGWISQTKSLYKLNELGFQVYPSFNRFLTSEIEPIMTYIKDYEYRIKNSKPEFPEDGLVIKVNDRKLWSEIGSNSKAPKWAVAYKFEPEHAITKLLDVEVQVGRTGKITPVAIMEPVRISGSRVSRATLHNFDEIERLGLKIGDYVQIEKAAEIIPKVRKVIKERRNGSEREIEIPKYCPACGYELEKPEFNVDLYCNNPNCEGTAYFRLLHFASRQCMDIRGLGSKILERLYDEGLIKYPDDIYNLHNYKNELIALDVLGYKSTENLLEAIEVSKGRPLHKVIFALAIPEIGESVSNKIAARVKNFKNITFSDIDKMEFLTSSASKSLKKWIVNPENIELMNKLEKVGISFENLMSEKRFSNNSLNGKNIVITGSFREFKDRDEIKEILKTFGANISNNVSKNTDYLIAGTGTEDGSKMRKAKELGIIIWNEDILKEKLK